MTDMPDYRVQAIRTIIDTVWFNVTASSPEEAVESVDFLWESEMLEPNESVYGDSYLRAYTVTTVDPSVTASDILPDSTD